MVADKLTSLCQTRSVHTVTHRHICTLIADDVTSLCVGFVVFVVVFCFVVLLFFFTADNDASCCRYIFCQ